MLKDKRVLFPYKCVVWRFVVLCKNGLRTKSNNLPKLAVDSDQSISALPKQLVIDEPFKKGKKQYWYHKLCDGLKSIVSDDKKTISIARMK